MSPVRPRVPITITSARLAFAKLPLGTLPLRPQQLVVGGCRDIRVRDQRQHRKHVDDEQLIFRNAGREAVEKSVAWPIRRETRIVSVPSPAATMSVGRRVSSGTLAWRHMHGLLGARACPSGAGWSHLPWDAVTKTQRKCPPHHAALPRHRGHAPCTPSRAWVGRRDNGGSALMWGVLALACKLVVNGRAKFAGLLTGVTVRC